MVYDEGFEINFDNEVFFAFSKYELDTSEVFLFFLKLEFC